MGKLKDFMGKALSGARQRKADTKAANQGSLSMRYTGIDASGSNPATGDLGPDAPQPPRGPKGPRDRPRGRQRRLGGDVRSPLSP